MQYVPAEEHAARIRDFDSQQFFALSSCLSFKNLALGQSFDGTATNEVTSSLSWGHSQASIAGQLDLLQDIDDQIGRVEQLAATFAATERIENTTSAGMSKLELEMKAFIDGVMKDQLRDIEETFAFGKKRATRGGARFKSEKLMCSYMKEFAGAHQHDFNSTKVYCNADGPAKGTDEDIAREKAVRKVVRVIIEANGGDGKTIKKDSPTRSDGKHPDTFYILCSARCLNLLPLRHKANPLVRV